MTSKVKKSISVLLALTLMIGLFTSVSASSNIMQNANIWRYQTGITTGASSNSNDKIKIDYNTNGILDGLYFDPNGTGNFSDKILNDFSMQINEGANSYNSDNVSIISQDGISLNGYDKNYDFFKRRMSEFNYNGTYNNRYISTMYTEFIKDSDIVYLYPRLHFKQSASPSTIKYNFKFPSTKFDKIYYDVQPQQILQDNSYVNQEFTEGFENGFSNWNSDYGTPSVNTIIKYSGSNSYVVNEDLDSISKTFSSNENGIVTIWYYDNASNTNETTAAFVDNGNLRGLGVITSFNSGEYIYRLDSTLYSTGISRSTGWHELKWDYSSGTKLDMYIDGTLVSTSTGVTSFKNIEMGDMWGSGISQNCFDDITVTPHIFFNGDNLLNASGSFEKTGGWNINYSEIDSSTVVNPKYELTDGIPGWREKNDVTTQQASGGKYGNYSLQLTNNSTTDYDGQIRAKFDVTKGDQYTVSAWVKATAAGTSAKLWIDGFTSYQTTATNLSTSTWTQLSYTFTIDPNYARPNGIGTLQLSLCLSSSAGDAILIDGVKAELGGSATPYGNNLAGLSTSTVLYNSSTQEGLVIYTPLNYPEVRKWYSDDYVRDAFLNYKINRQTVGNELVLTYEVAGQSMQTSNTEDFYFYVRPFKGSVINDGISAFKNNINTSDKFGEAYATVTTLNKMKDYYPIEGYADQFYHLGFSTLHKGKATGMAPWNDTNSQTDWGVNGERGFNWGFITNNIGTIGNALESYYRNLTSPAQALQDDIYRYIINYIDKTCDSKWNGVYTSGGMPNYKMLSDGLKSQFQGEGLENEAYNNFFFAQTPIAVLKMLYAEYGKFSLSDKQSLVSKMNGLKEVFSKDGKYTWTQDINHLANGGSEESSAVSTGNWTSVGSVAVTPGTYTNIRNNGTDIEFNYAKSSFTSNVGTDYSSQVNIKSNLAGGAKVWVTSADNPELIDSTPLSKNYNSDLETGNLNYWSIYSQGTGDTIALETGEKHSGNNSVKYTHNSTSSNAQCVNGSYTDTVVGRKYKATAWVKSADSNPVDVTINVANAKNKTFTIGSTWTQISTIIYASATSFTSVRISIPQGKSVYIDDLVYAETSEDYYIDDDNSNADLENGTVNCWQMINQGTGDQMISTSEKKYAGNYALKYTHNSSNSNAFVKHTTADVSSIGGKYFKATAWVKSANSGNVNVTISIAGAYEKTYSVGADWTCISALGYAYNGDYNSIRISIPTGKAVYIDNASLGITYETNNILNANDNGGVESGTSASWQIYNEVSGDTAEVVTSDKHTGSYAIKYTRANTDTTHIKNISTTNSTVGKRYRASVWVKATDKHPINATISLNGASPREYLIGDAWTQISTVATATNEAFNIIRLQIPVSKSILIDDAVIMEVTDKKPVYSTDINNASWSTIKGVVNAESESSNLKIYMKPGNEVLIDTKTVQKISEWSASGDSYTEISDNSTEGSHSLVYKNQGNNVHDNYIESTLPVGKGLSGNGMAYVASARVKAKTGTTAKVWMDMSDIYSSRTFLNGGLNGDIEYGNTDNWVITNKTANDTVQQVTSNKYSGDYGLQYTCGSANAGLRYSFSESSSPGKNYKLRAWVKSDSGTVDVTMSLAGKQQSTYTVGTSWQEINTIVETADGNVNYADFKIPSGKSIYVDDVIIEETTETNVAAVPLTNGCNSGVESGTTSDWGIANQGTGDSMQVVTGNVHAGTYALRYTHNSSNPAFVYLNTNGTSVAGKQYRASIWVKNANAGTVPVQISVSGAAENACIVNNNEWTKITTYVEALSEYYNAIRITIPTGSSIIVDDAELIETTEHVALNFSSNGGMEMGDTTNYSKSGSSDTIEVVSNEKHSGSYGLKFTTSSSNTGKSSLYHISKIQSDTGVKINFSVWAKSATGSNVVLDMSLGGAGEVQYTVGNTWTKMEGTLDAELPFTTLYINMDKGQSVYLDDFVIDEQDGIEPLQYYTINDSSWTLISQKQQHTLSTVQKLKIYTRPGDEILIDAAQVEPGSEADQSFQTGYFFEYSPLHQPKTPTIINSHVDAVLTAMYMKKLANLAEDTDSYNYWNDMCNRGIDGLLWFIKKDNAFKLHDLIYQINGDANGHYGNYTLCRIEELFYYENYRKTEIQSYIWQMVQNYLNDNADDNYVPNTERFAFEVTQILYGLVWNDLTGLLTIETNWQTVYPTYTLADIRAVGVYNGKGGVPALDDKWYYSYVCSKDFTSNFGGLQLNDKTYYIENSTDTSETVTISFIDRDASDSYGLSNITQANELISNTTLTITNNSVQVTIPARGFRIIQLTVN